jgi:hypothetical protein
MEKVVPLFKTFTTIFYFKIFKLNKVLFRPVKILKQFELGLNPFKFEFKSDLNRLRRYCGRGPPISGRPPHAVVGAHLSIFPPPLFKQQRRPRPPLSG